MAFCRSNSNGRGTVQAHRDPSRTLAMETGHVPVKGSENDQAGGGAARGLDEKDARALTATLSTSSCCRAVCPRLAQSHRRPHRPHLQPRDQAALRLCTPLGCDFCLHPATEPSEGAPTGLETEGQTGGGGGASP